jgi:hypothetical protein
LPADLKQALHEKTITFMRDLFEGEEISMLTDPNTGEVVFDIRKVCDKLGLDFETERDKMLTDPILSKGLWIVER